MVEILHGEHLDDLLRDQNEPSQKQASDAPGTRRDSSCFQGQSQEPFLATCWAAGEVTAEALRRRRFV